MQLIKKGVEWVLHLHRLGEDPMFVIKLIFTSESIISL